MPQVPDNSFHPATRAQWRAWLKKNHDRSSGVWLISYKKSAGKATVSYNDAVEEALCFGWIDSKPGKLDELRTMLWFSPRKPRSAWAGTNKARIERLIRQNLMTPAGLAKIEAAKKDSSWDALTAVEAMVIPPDLQAALRKHKGAAHFDAFPGGVKRQILQWIVTAKRPETRAKRVEETATLAARNIRANQWTPKP